MYNSRTTYIPPLKRLSWRLPGLLILMILVTLLMISGSVYYFISRTESQMWEARQSESARFASDRVADFIERVKDTLTVISLLDRQTLTEKPGLIENILAQNLALLELVRLDKTGLVIAAANTNADTPVLADLFTIPQSRWFTQSRAGQLYLGAVQLSFNNQPYLIMAIPALDGGVVAARLRMNLLGDVVSTLHFGETGQAYVVNQTGEIVAHPNPEVALNRTSLSGRPEMAGLQPGPDQTWSSLYINFAGNKVIGVTHPIRDTQWVIFTEVTEAEALSVSRAAITLLGLGLGLFGLLILLVTTNFMARLILRPLEALRAGVIQIGEGDFEHAIVIDRQDEVGQVAQAFNDMVAQLRKRDAEIMERTQALRESEERFQQVIKSISDTIYMTEITPTGQRINRYISPNVVEFTGYELDVFMKQWDYWGVMIHPDDRAAAAAQADRFLQGQDSDTEYRLIKADGEIIWVRDNGRVRRDIITNNPIVYGVVSNITAHKQAEAALQQQRDFLQQVIDINPHFIFAKDREGRFTLANKAFSRAYGTTVQDLIGKTEDEASPNRLLIDRYNREDRNVIDTGKELIIPEDKIVNNFGQARWSSTVKRPILDETGQAYQVLGVATDITALKVTEQNLARALDAAREVNQFKTQLLANVSHDLRTPLNAILGHTEMLQKGIHGPITERQQKIIERVITNTKNLTIMVNRLVDQARLEAGTLMLEITPFTPANLLAQIHATMDILAETKHLNLTSAIAPNVPETILGDFYQLIQILQNLVGNAIKFTEQGSVAVRIFCPSPHEWGIEVTDTGPGIPFEAQAYIFEAFRQVDGTSTRKYGGSGLGLSIVKQLVTMMNGDVSVQSQPGQGSVFRVILPIISSEEKHHD